MLEKITHDIKYIESGGYWVANVLLMNSIAWKSIYI